MYKTELEIGRHIAIVGVELDNDKWMIVLRGVVEDWLSENATNYELLNVNKEYSIKLGPVVNTICEIIFENNEDMCLFQLAWH